MKADGQLYLDLMKRTLTNTIYRGVPVAWVEGQPVFDTTRREHGTPWLNIAHTMVSVRRLDNLQFCLERALADGVPGDFIETGVWHGGACIFARSLFKAHGVQDRTVWVADSFQGVPTTTAGSHPMDQELALHEKNAMLAVSEETVRENFSRYELLDEQVSFLSGWFADTLPGAPISQLAVIRLDGDLYSSTMDALEHLYPKLSPRGYVIVDDYGIPACATAVHEYREQHGIEDEICFIDPYSIYWRRSTGSSGW
ncbi:hypothetical protein F4560_001716 [Saccharothrix ecbatanensis]|uniref:Macrocin O-methyltransferase n=1 Tax=Saccharothrix ecbatanensis TaxID=1105145 RepID=A0A7W9HGP8_9PSEU|nr:TylF/MycF family methyltransferase [Saccharothrix ecbatanensis]MBB5801948.1 hypothetical protein [Saccharothrix ecbatanensis]